MDSERYPAEGQMVTAVTVRDGDAHVLVGTTILQKAERLVVRFEADDSAHVPTKGQSLTLLYGGDVRVLRLRAKVTEQIEGLKVLLSPQGPVTEGERREFLRAEIPVRMYCEVVGPDHVLPGEESAPDTSQPGWSDETVDLSGSGVRFFWDSICKAGDLMLVRMQLPLPSNPVVAAIGEVVRAKHDADSGKLDVATHFTTVAMPDRDRMINCVFRTYYDQLGVRGPVGLGDDEA